MSNTINFHFPQALNSLNTLILHNNPDFYRQATEILHIASGDYAITQEPEISGSYLNDKIIDLCLKWMCEKGSLYFWITDSGVSIHKIGPGYSSHTKNFDDIHQAFRWFAKN